MKRLNLYLEKDGRKILDNAETLRKDLTQLRYEGKVSLVKNLKNVGCAAQSLKEVVSDHHKFQEKVLFPFLECHMPKYESRIQFLRTDHVEIMENTKKLISLLKSIPQKTEKQFRVQAGSIQEIGVYLVCLTNHHIRLEEEGIHKALRKDLKSKEVKEIVNKIQKWHSD